MGQLSVAPSGLTSSEGSRPCAARNAGMARSNERRVIRFSLLESRQVGGDIVDVLIGVNREQFPVLLHGVVQLDFRNLAIAAEGARGAVWLGQGDDEVVDAAEGSLDLRAVRPRHRDG